MIMYTCILYSRILHGKPDRVALVSELMLGVDGSWVNVCKHIQPQSIIASFLIIIYVDEK